MGLFCEQRVWPTPGCAYVAARPFTWRGGRQFAAGEAFPHRDLGLSDLEAEQLWSATEIEVAPPAPPAPPAPKPAPQPQKRR